MNVFIRFWQSSSDNRKLLITCMVLITAIIAAYWQVWTYDFTNWDDTIYVTENRKIQNGVTFENLAWSLNIWQKGAYWHPLTWLSHMLDCQLFGLNAGMHHLTSLLFHVSNSILLLFAIRIMSGSFRVGLLAALLFALHPVNVDSVAWVSERKSLLSTFFWLATILAYLRYVKKPNMKTYGLILLLFIAGLMSKPVLVTLPFVFLLMDYWPLGRFKQAVMSEVEYPGIEHRTVSWLIYEKVPLFLLIALTITFATISLKHQGALEMGHKIPMLLRAENAIVSYVAYIGKMIWPANLATYYPFPSHVPPLKTVSAIIFLLALTGFCIRNLRKRPWLCFGWFWYLGTLVPMSGIVQGGEWPAMADRWAYVPFIGLFLMIAGGTVEILDKLNPGKKIIGSGLVLTLLAALAVTTYFQQKTWANSTTLFRHALKVTGSTWLAHNNLGAGLLKDDKLDEAAIHLEKAIEINPWMPNPYISLAKLEEKRDNPDGVILNISRAIKLDPDTRRHYLRLGNAQAKKGEFEAAVESFQKALTLSPENPYLHARIGFVLTQAGKYIESISYLEKSLSLDRDNPETHLNLAGAYFKTGQAQKAITSYQDALKLNPELTEAYLNLGIAYTMVIKYEEAIDLFEKAISIDPEKLEAKQYLAELKYEIARWDNQTMQLKTRLEQNPDDPNLHFRLGSVYQASGRLDEAIEAYRKTIALDPGFLSAFQSLATVHSLRKEYDQALETFFELDQLSPKNPVVSYNIAAMFALKNETDKSLEWLRKSMENGYTDLEMINTDPDLENVRRSPEFKNLVRKFQPS